MRWCTVRESAACSTAGARRKALERSLKGMRKWALAGAALAILVGVGPVSASANRAYAGTAAFNRLMAEHAAELAPTPTYARQTGLACSVCHTQIPELTAFGRAFKLNGYVLRTTPTITAKNGKRTTLSIGTIPALSFMVQTSVTELSKAVPGTHNGDVLLPDQLSLFLGGEVTPNIGGFVQVTYDPQSGTIGLDNTDLRYASATHLFKKPLVLGLTLNNNPTVQDLWNSTPAWGFPYASSPSAPTPMAASLIDGTLAGSVAGLTGYAQWDNLLYAEFGAYRSAPVGEDRPLPTDQPGIIKGAAPYWRLALQHQWSKDYLMVGTYGMGTDLYVGGTQDGAANTYRDVAFDAQWDHTFDDNSAIFSAHTTYIHETVTPADVANGEPDETTLNTFRIDGTVLYHRWVGFTLAPFMITGTSNAVMYGPDAVTGSANGSPNSSGLIAAIHFSPWLNTRLTVQYTAYSKFNGGTTNYDGSGRNASDNNRLYLVTWLLF